MSGGPSSFLSESAKSGKPLACTGVSCAEPQHCKPWPPSLQETSWCTPGWAQNYYRFPINTASPLLISSLITFMEMINRRPATRELTLGQTKASQCHFQDLFPWYPVDALFPEGTRRVLPNPSPFTTHHWGSYWGPR